MHCWLLVIHDSFDSRAETLFTVHDVSVIERGHVSFRELSHVMMTCTQHPDAAILLSALVLVQCSANDHRGRSRNWPVCSGC